MNVEYEQIGSIGLAQTNDRWLTLKRLLGETKVRDIECHLLTPEECKEKCPLIRVDDLEGGIWIPQGNSQNSMSFLFAYSDANTNTRRIIIFSFLH